METGHLRTRWPFFGLHLILGGKLDVERREDLFFILVFIDIFSGNGNRKLRPLPFSNFWARPWVSRHILVSFPNFLFSWWYSMLNMAFIKVVNDQYLFKWLLGTLQTYASARAQKKFQVYRVLVSNFFFFFSLKSQSWLSTIKTWLHH